MQTYRLTDGPMLPRFSDPRRERFRRWLVSLLILSVLLAALAVWREPLLIGFAYRFRNDDPARSDALVVLLGGLDHRPAKAAALYRKNLAPLILLATAKVNAASGHDESSESRMLLIRGGVPAEAIRILPQIATSTRDEALYAREYARTHPMRRLTVVTTAFHTARARWIFQRVFRGTGIEIRTAAADHPDFTERDWYTKDESLATYFVELVKTIYYRLAY